MCSHTWRPGGFTLGRSISFCPQSVLSQLTLFRPKPGSLQPLKIQLSAPSSWDTSYDLVKELVFQLPIQGRLCLLFFPATLFYYSFRRVVHDIHYSSYTALPKVVNHSVVIIFLWGSLFSRPIGVIFTFPGHFIFRPLLSCWFLLHLYLAAAAEGRVGVNLSGISKLKA